ASLTKLMTAYVALDAVRRGKITLQTPMRVSRRAYRMAPSKMGFKPGTEVTLENALKIIMVKSANDVSVTIAEGISGSVEAFAAQMNATARSLGMYQSHFVNPNGLHNESHYSSARDMAILARALFLHFPAQHELYGIGAIRVGRRVMRNHNGIIGRYPGANGMKTGYVCAAGFNVVASATRYGKTIITVVLGSPSPTVRTFQAMALLDKGFGNSGYGGPQLQSLPRSAYRAPPNMRSEICNRTRRRQLIQQYAASVSRPVTSSAWSGRANAYSHDSNSAAAFFAADKRGNFNTSDDGEESGDDTRSHVLRLPPRTSFTPIHVYVGRAPGWTGPVAGPAAAEADNSNTDKSERTAARSEEKAGEPLSLRGSRTARTKKANKHGKVLSRKQQRAKRAALRKSKARKSRKAIRSRKAVRNKPARRSSLRKRSSRR
ncbi:MAG: D-alanyl-D-alanine carboxypeptidase, partial [Hyphomicrobiales bacterium]|nr:D-alanyl-D-alanine carboxypeptidase [Hyphomicrobiales bacterium]